jgi:hypothetical protein
MKFLILSSFLFLLAPCNEPKQITSTPTPPSRQENLKAMVIGYQKTVCFGTCPAFTMTINAETNKISYTGESNVEKLGNYTKNISDEELFTLSEAFDKANFFELKDEYNSEMTDIPSKYVSYSFGGKSKKIRDRYNAPAELKELESLLDKIADSEGWEKVKEQE